MRADVKLGIVSSAVIVLLAGGYYLWRSPSDAPIRLSDSTSSVKRSASTPGVVKKAPPRAATRSKATPSRKGTTPNTGRHAQQTNRRTATRPQHAGGNTRKQAPRKTPVVAQKKPGAQAPGGTPKPRGVAKRPRASTGTAAKKTSLSPQKHQSSSPRRATPTKGVAGGRPSVTRPQGTPIQQTANRRSPSQPNKRAARTLTGVMPRKVSRAATNNVAVETHVVQPGDSFAALARNYYGSERYTDYLIQSNPQLSDPRRLKIGASVRIPPRPDDATAAGPSSTRKQPAHRKSGASTRGGANGTSRTYRVRPGDSFYAIARDRLGDATRWRELFELNKSLVNGDPTSLRAGQEIAVPAK